MLDRAHLRRGHTVKRVRRGLVIVTVALVLGWCAFLRPTFLAGSASYVLVVGHSMEPTLHNGDLVIIRQQSVYRRGDIVAYRVPQGEPAAGSLVIHRVTGGSRDGYELTGDNKDQPDLWHPTASDVVGKLAVRVPFGGTALWTLRQPYVAGALAALAAMSATAPLGSRRRREPFDRPVCVEGAASVKRTEIAISWHAP